MQAIESWKAKAEGRAHVDYGFHVVVSDAADETLAEMPRLVAAGYPSVKVFMIDEFGIGDEALLQPASARRGRRARSSTCTAENGDMLDHCARGMRAAGRLGLRYYAESRPVAGRGRGHAAGHRLRRAGRRRSLHRAPRRARMRSRR